MHLYNKKNKKEQLEEVKKNAVPRRTVSFYRYHRLPNPSLFRDHLYLQLEPIGVLGRIYVAEEGINAQVSVPENNWVVFVEKLQEITFLEGNRLNLAVEDNPASFAVLKIKLRKKIVADGLDDNSFNPSNCGQHLDAEAFNHLAKQENTILIDMRNHYESEVGHFKGAVCPDVDTFRDSLPIVEEILEEHREKNILMYCTGGIRCEKASAWFKHRGFPNVFQLEGGIIKYARDVKEHALENLFTGKNFVFDERLGERISEEIISHCHQCGNASDSHTNCRNEACHLLFIQCGECAEMYEGCCSADCKETIQLPEEEQKTKRSGQSAQRNVFRKGRIEDKIRGMSRQP
jgi:UPF0176 protein